MLKNGIRVLYSAAPKGDSNKAISDKLDLILSAQTQREAQLNEYLTKSEVADLLRVSEKSVDTMRRKAIIPEPKKIPPFRQHEGQDGSQMEEAGDYLLDRRLLAFFLCCARKPFACECLVRLMYSSAEIS